MKPTHIAMAVAALLVLRPRPKQTAPLAAAPNYLVDSSNWYEDQWARLYAADLPPTDAQSPHLPYGVSAAMSTGFNV